MFQKVDRYQKNNVSKSIVYVILSMSIFSFIEWTLMALFRKPGNQQQICKQTSSTFYISNYVSLLRRKNYWDVITRTFL